MGVSLESVTAGALKDSNISNSITAPVYFIGLKAYMTSVNKAY